MSIFLHKIKHKLWENYKLYPPIKYSKINFFSKTEHSFNKIYNSKKNKIIEFEQILLMTGSSTNYEFMISNKKKLLDRLKQTDIKYLIAPTEIAKKNALYYLDNDINLEKKIKIIYPSIDISRLKKSFSKTFFQNNQLKLLFIGQKFYGKGGPICFDIAKKLNIKKINFIFKFVCSDIPKNITIPENVIVLDNKISEEVKYELYEWADFFIFPVIQDSFGVYLECLETQTVIISNDIYDKSEIIIDKKIGDLVKIDFQLYDILNFGSKWKNWFEFQEIFKKNYEKDYFDDISSNYVKILEAYINNPKNYYSIQKNIYDYALNKFNPNKRNNELIKIYNSI